MNSGHQPRITLNFVHIKTYAKERISFICVLGFLKSNVITVQRQFINAIAEHKSTNH